MTEPQLIRDLAVAAVLALKQTAVNFEVVGQPCDQIWKAIGRFEQLHCETEKLLAREDAQLRSET